MTHTQRWGSEPSTIRWNHGNEKWGLWHVFMKMGRNFINRPKADTLRIFPYKEKIIASKWATTLSKTWKESTRIRQDDDHVMNNVTVLFQITVDFYNKATNYCPYKKITDLAWPSNISLKSVNVSFYCITKRQI